MTKETHNCLSFWYPKLVAAGAPSPKTLMVKTEVKLWDLLDGRMPDGYENFMSQLRSAAADVGYPCFLRTGYFSGKHRWKTTCFVPTEKDLSGHVCALVEESGMGIIDLPTDVWVVREMLDLDAEFTAFLDMPVAKERRFFVEHGEVLCAHPYWVEDAVARGWPKDPRWKEKLAALNAWGPAEYSTLKLASSRFSQDFVGAWSMDWAFDRKSGSWVVIDMAVAERSWHPDCKVAIKRGWPQQKKKKVPDHPDPFDDID